MKLILLAFILILFACSPAQEAELPPEPRGPPIQEIEQPVDSVEQEPAQQEFVDQSQFEVSTSSVTISSDGEYRYITGNGLPDHQTGEFPNEGNPNTISEQNVDVKVTLNPVRTSAATAVQKPGIALNGVIMEPGTAETWGCGGQRCRIGETPDGDVWNIEAIQDTYNLGLDQNNAHVQPTGTYHYHGVPEGMLEGGLEHVGWAADGFPMYHSHDYASSYRLKDGARPSDGPDGDYDGTYTQDYEYVEGLGDLDQCNGAFVESEEFPDGTYAYFLTDDFPFISRCLYGTPDESFNNRGISGGQTSGPNQEPPQVAVNACISKVEGATCSFSDGRTITGVCRQTPNGLACVPSR